MNSPLTVRALVILVLDAGPAHGAEIRDRIRERTGCQCQRGEGTGTVEEIFGRIPVNNEHTKAIHHMAHTYRLVIEREFIERDLHFPGAAVSEFG